MTDRGSRAAPVTPKAVLRGGECDGRIVRLPDGPPPAELVILVPDDTGRAYAAPDYLTPAVPARPVVYVLHRIPGSPRSSVHLYQPKRGRPTP